MKLRIAYEYIDYLVEHPVAFGDQEIASLDLTAQVEHYTSSSCTDPIVSCGMGARYRIDTIDIPAWANPIRWLSDYTYRGNCIQLLHLPNCDANPAYAKLAELPEIDCRAAIALLSVTRFRSPFLESLRAQLEAWLREDNPKYGSPLSYKQRDAVCAAYHIRY